jgi:hypothetical protein
MNAQDNVFMKTPRFGVLSYCNVYNFYVEPLIFTAVNEFGQLFFCYSLGIEDGNDVWIVIPVSQELVHKLEQKEIPVVKMIKQSKTSRVFLFRVDLETQDVTETDVPSNSLKYKMPNDKYFIRENINYDGSREHTHKIRIASQQSKQIPSGVLDRASEAFGDFCRHYLKKFGIAVSIYSLDAIRGSFVYRVQAVQQQGKKAAQQQDEKAPDFKVAGYEYLSRINTRDKFVASLEDREVDLRIVRKLFDIISKHDLKIQFIEESSTESLVSLTPDYVNGLIAIIDENLNKYLDSSMVPQADNLDTLKKYLTVLDDEHIVTAEKLGVVPRQVSYYRDACEMLGLVHEYSTLTPTGIRAKKADDNDFIKIIKHQFENSDCGYMWMKSAGVDNILNIDENSAADFLIQECNGLSESTSRRRAQTLKSWVLKIKQFA